MAITTLQQAAQQVVAKFDRENKGYVDVSSKTTDGASFDKDTDWYCNAQVSRLGKDTLQLSKACAIPRRIPSAIVGSDLNSDGKVTAEEIVAKYKQMLDTNQDGQLSKSEQYYKKRVGEDEFTQIITLGLGGRGSKVKFDALDPERMARFMSNDAGWVGTAPQLYDAKLPKSIETKTPEVGAPINVKVALHLTSSKATKLMDAGFEALKSDEHKAAELFGEAIKATNNTGDLKQIRNMLHELDAALDKVKGSRRWSPMEIPEQQAIDKILKS